MFSYQHLCPSRHKFTVHHDVCNSYSLYSDVCSACRYIPLWPAQLVTLLKTLNLNLKTQLNPINVSVIGGSQTDVTDGGVENKPAKERKSFSAFLPYQVGTLRSDCRLKFSPHAHTSKTCTWSPYFIQVIPDKQEAPYTPPLRQSSSSSSSGTKMSCSSSSAAKFLLIRVPTYKKGTTTRAILKRPKGVCFPGVTHHHRNSYIRLPQAAPAGVHI